MCSVGELDPCDVWSEHVVTARKTHECDACDTLIRPGEPYLRHFDLYEGTASNEKMCAACWCIREAFSQAHGVTYQPSSLIQFLGECVLDNDDPEDPWRPLLAAVKRRQRVSARGRAFLRHRWDERRELRARRESSHA